MATRQVVVTVNKAAQDFLATLGGARSPELAAAAKVLRREIKKELSHRGHGQPSAPGQPPNRQTGALERSVKEGVVGSGRRVAVTDFTAPFLEYGVNTRADQAHPRSRRDLFTGLERLVSRDSARALARKVGRRGGGASGKVRHQVIEPRPFMEKPLERSTDEMVALAVHVIRSRTPST